MTPETCVNGIKSLLSQIKQGQPEYREALLLEARLERNIADTRKVGDNPILTSQWIEIIDLLNDLSLRVLHVSFNSLCSQGTTSSTQTVHTNLSIDLITLARKYIVAVQPLLEDTSTLFTSNSDIWPSECTDITDFLRSIKEPIPQDNPSLAISSLAVDLNNFHAQMRRLISSMEKFSAICQESPRSARTLKQRNIISAKLDALVKNLKAIREHMGLSQSKH